MLDSTHEMRSTYREVGVASAVLKELRLNGMPPASYAIAPRTLSGTTTTENLIGIIAIGDPVFSLLVRDNLIKWDSHARGERVVNIMDAYVLGALPPYNALLGGKLVACLIRSRDIYDDFARTYGKTKGIISKEEKKARLLALTWVEQNDDNS